MCVVAIQIANKIIKNYKIGRFGFQKQRTNRKNGQ